MSAPVAANPNFPANLSISPSSHLFLPNNNGGRQQDEDDAFGPDSQRNAIELYGIAGRVWEAAYAINAYILSSPGIRFDPPFSYTLSTIKLPSKPITVIELGSGTGVTAAALAKSLRLVDPKATVIATDLAEVCPLLEENLAHKNDNIWVRPLAWGDVNGAVRLSKEVEEEGKALTSIVCSDLVYFPELFAPLLRTLLLLTSAVEYDISVTISYKIRSMTKEAGFWSAFGLWFEFMPVLARYVCKKEMLDLGHEHDDQEEDEWTRFGSEEGMFVFSATRRVGSKDWKVHDDDYELMAGVGAMGTEERKNDGQFEELMLMAMGGEV